MSIKQVIVIRTKYPDGRGGTIGLRTGKIAAQVAHASMKVFLDRKLADTRHGGTFLMVPLTPAMVDWVHGTFTKVILGVETEEDLLCVYEAAEAAGLPTALVTDVGKTELKADCPVCRASGSGPYGADGPCPSCGGTGRVSVPTHTCVAIGPAEVEAIDQITGPEGLVRCRLL